MNEFKVKNKLNGFVYIVRAYDSNHAINKAIERVNFTLSHKDFVVIK